MRRLALASQVERLEGEVTAQSAKKGLFQNSTNICVGSRRATLKLTGQNGKAHDSKPLVGRRQKK